MWFRDKSFVLSEVQPRETTMEILSFLLTFLRKKKVKYKNQREDCGHNHPNVDSIVTENSSHG